MPECDLVLVVRRRALKARKLETGLRSFQASFGSVRHRASRVCQVYHHEPKHVGFSSLGLSMSWEEVRQVQVERSAWRGQSRSWNQAEVP